MGANESRSQEPTDRRSSTGDGTTSAAERRFREKFPSGYMNKSQFISYYKLMTMSTMSDEECDNLFAIADSNEDGEVSFAEFQLFCEILRSGSVEDRLRLTFKLYDKDKSKGITRDEIVRMLKVCSDFLFVYLNLGRACLFAERIRIGVQPAAETCWKHH
jgi:Ca2+-binding EF-hand superfamily protein